MNHPDFDTETSILTRRPTLLRWDRRSWIMGVVWERGSSTLHVCLFPMMRVSVHVPIRPTQTRAKRWFRVRLIYVVAIAMLVTGIAFGFVVRLATESATAPPSFTPLASSSASSTHYAPSLDATVSLESASDASVPTATAASSTLVTVVLPMGAKPSSSSPPVPSARSKRADYLYDRF